MALESTEVEVLLREVLETRQRVAVELHEPLMIRTRIGERNRSVPAGRAGSVDDRGRALIALGGKDRPRIVLVLLCNALAGERKREQDRGQRDDGVTECGHHLTRGRRRGQAAFPRY